MHDGSSVGAPGRRGVRPKNCVALLTLVALLGACSGGSGNNGAEHKPTLVLGLSQIAAEANWGTANANSIRNAARDRGITLRLEDAHRSQEKQVDQLRDFVRQRVDVIAFSPVVESGWEAVLREVRSAGIPVVLMDRAIEINDTSLYVSLVGSDFVEEGRRAGRWLLRHAPDVQDEIGIVELQGTVDSAPANGRNQGFFEVIAPDARYRMIRSESGDFDRTRARDLMTEFLQANGRRIRVV